MLKKIVIIIFGILFLLIAVKAAIQVIKLSPFFFQLLFNRDINLKKADSKINILLLGVGGGTHDGPNLTDTIIFASLDQDKNKANLISIPRDLWIPDIEGRINSAYEDGEKEGKRKGKILAQAVVSKVLGQKIDYVAKIDFSGFVKAVDVLDGIDVNVENTLNDYQYPISGKENDLCGHNQDEIPILATASSQLDAFPCRYTHIHFDKGSQHMNGEQTLEFVRSRHAEGNEGSDFARSRRQELVIKAIKDKTLSLNVLLNPNKIISLYSTLQGSIDTNIKEDEFDDFIRLFQKMKKAKIQTTVLDYGDEQTNRVGILINPPLSAEFNYAWILIPRIGNGNFSEIQKYVDCQIKLDNCSILKNPLY